MIIKDEIMEKVKEKELYKKQFDRCISTRVCPECGRKLTNRYRGGFFTLYGKTEYECTSCEFTYTEG